MVDEAKEQRTPTEEIRKFELPVWEKILAQQRGRVTRLIHPDCETTYFLDVTDRVDPTTEENITLGEFLKPLIEDPQCQNTYAYNNGVVALITNLLDGEERMRVYIGATVPLLEGKERMNRATRILHKAGLQSNEFNVPFSFYSGQALNLIRQEALEAIREASPGQKENLFVELQEPALPKLLS